MQRHCGSACKGTIAISDRKLFNLVVMASAVWLGSAILFLFFHRMGPWITLGGVCGLLFLIIALKCHLLPLGPLEEWYEDFVFSRRIARMRRIAHEEQVAADPINQEILYIQQFASPKMMRMLRAGEFMDVAVRHFRLLGYARRHQRIRDGGDTDAILRRGENLYLLRCLKLETGQIGEAEVAALAALLAGNSCAGGILVTNLAFAPEAEQAALKHHIALLDGTTLAGSIMAFPLREPTD